MFKKICSYLFPSSYYYGLARENYNDLNIDERRRSEFELEKQKCIKYCSKHYGVNEETFHLLRTSRKRRSF